MSEKAQVVSYIPKIRLVRRDQHPVFGWEASQAVHSAQVKKKAYPSKPPTSIAAETEEFLLQEIAEAVAASKTHTHVLKMLETEVEGSEGDASDYEIGDRGVSLGESEMIAIGSSSSSALHLSDGQLTSPQPDTKLKRKNPPAGTSRPKRGGTVQKQSQHSNHGGAKSSSHNKSMADELALKGILKSYPTSLEFHTMHGNFALFARTLFPIERQMIKYFTLKMVGKTQLSEVRAVLVKDIHRPLLHKVCRKQTSRNLFYFVLSFLILTHVYYVYLPTMPTFFVHVKMWDVRQRVLEHSKNPLLQQMRVYVRPRNDTELWTLANQLIALDEVHQMLDAGLYQKSNPHQQSMVTQMAQAFNKAQESSTDADDRTEQLGPIPSSIGSLGSSVDLRASSSSSSSSSSVVDFDCQLSAPTAAHLLTAHEISSLVADADHGSVPSSASATSAPMATTTTEYDDAPGRFTAEEAELLWRNEYNIRRKTEQKNDHNWEKMEAIFATAAGTADQTSHRTIWPRSRDKLRNYYFNHQTSQQAKRPRINEDAVSRGPIEDSGTARETGRDGSESGLVADAAEMVVAANVADYEAGAVVTSGSAVASSISSMPVRVLRSDDIADDEKDCILKAGKALMADNSQVTGAALLAAYCAQFPTHRRVPATLLAKWQSWFKNQKKANSVWFRSLAK